MRISNTIALVSALVAFASASYTWVPLATYDALYRSTPIDADFVSGSLLSRETIKIHPAYGDLAHADGNELTAKIHSLAAKLGVDLDDTNKSAHSIFVLSNKVCDSEDLVCPRKNKEKYSTLALKAAYIELIELERMVNSGHYRARVDNLTKKHIITETSSEDINATATSIADLLADRLPIMDEKGRSIPLEHLATLTYDQLVVIGNALNVPGIAAFKPQRSTKKPKENSDQVDRLRSLILEEPRRRFMMGVINRVMESKGVHVADFSLPANWHGLGLEALISFNNLIMAHAYSHECQEKIAAIDRLRATIRELHDLLGTDSDDGAFADSVAAGDYDTAIAGLSRLSDSLRSELPAKHADPPVGTSHTSSKHARDSPDIHQEPVHDRRSVDMPNQTVHDESSTPASAVTRKSSKDHSSLQQDECAKHEQSDDRIQKRHLQMLQYKAELNDTSYTPTYAELCAGLGPKAADEKMKSDLTSLWSLYEARKLEHVKSLYATMNEHEEEQVDWDTVRSTYLRKTARQLEQEILTLAKHYEELETANKVLRSEIEILAKIMKVTTPDLDKLKKTELLSLYDQLQHQFEEHNGLCQRYASLKSSLDSKDDGDTYHDRLNEANEMPLEELRVAVDQLSDRMVNEGHEALLLQQQILSAMQAYGGSDTDYPSVQSMTSIPELKARLLQEEKISAKRKDAIRQLQELEREQEQQRLKLSRKNADIERERLQLIEDEHEMQQQIIALANRNRKRMILFETKAAEYVAKHKFEDAEEARRKIAMLHDEALEALDTDDSISVPNYKERMQCFNKYMALDAGEDEEAVWNKILALDAAKLSSDEWLAEIGGDASRVKEMTLTIALASKGMDKAEIGKVLSAFAANLDAAIQHTQALALTPADVKIKREELAALLRELGDADADKMAEDTNVLDLEDAVKSSSSRASKMRTGAAADKQNGTSVSPMIIAGAVGAGVVLAASIGLIFFLRMR